jgi:hypothetical protein
MRLLQRTAAIHTIDRALLERTMIGKVSGMEGRQLIVREGQMVFDVPSGQGGVDEIVSVGDAHRADAAGPINLGGAWRSLADGEALLAALDRLGREAPPTPPIIAID